MNLDETQRQTVAKWISEGAKLSEIQKRLLELGIKLTYMEVRFLVDDLKLTPKDPEPPQLQPNLPPKKIPRRKEHFRLPAFP
jgi:transposase